MIEKQSIKHNNCPVAIRWKMFRGKEIPTPGLYCSCHNTWLEWLSYRTACELIDSGVQEQPYMKKQKVKSNK
jgi:hypothetical protein